MVTNLCSKRNFILFSIVCCQDTRGGLVDKPGKSRDYYHTCYTLSGLSVAQHLPCDHSAVLGDPGNLLVR